MTWHSTLDQNPGASLAGCLRSAMVYNRVMEGMIFFVLFMVLWFLVLPRIPGASRFT